MVRRPSAELLALCLANECEPPAAAAGGDPQPLYALGIEAFSLLLHYYKAQLHLLNKVMRASKL